MTRWIGSALAAAALALAAPANAQGDMRPVPRPGPPAPAPAVAPAPAADGGNLVLSSKAPAPRPAELLDGQAMRLALRAARNDDWETAALFAEREGPVAETLIEWQRIRAAQGDFAAARAFLAAHPDWPGLLLLRRKGEAWIPTGGDPAPVFDFFAEVPPQTGWGVQRLVEAHLAKGDEATAKAVLATAWTTLELSRDEERDLIAAHGAWLKDHHADRLDTLLWQQKRSAAARMLGRVDADAEAVARARLGLQRNSDGIDRLIEAVPERLLGDPGLTYDRMDWRIGKRRRDEAADMILAASASAETLGQPWAWANWRRVLARQNMREGNPIRAYALASDHHLTDGAAFADLEWLSGYLALRYMDDPARALHHFQRFAAVVDTPISLGRAGYWIGRAQEAMGDDKAATLAYRDGARYQTSFYGLLAAEKLGLPMDPVLPGGPPSPSWRTAEFAKSDVFQAAQLLFGAGQSWEAGRFLTHLSESLSDADAKLLADYTATLGDPYLAIRIGKKVARSGVVAPNAYFPLTRLGPGSLPVSEALALAIARRESEFFAGAVSPAGARGMMQLMPATAKAMAGDLGLPYSRARLTSDPTYNVRLGSAYLSRLIEEFGNNIILVSVGYNAGPSRARTWMDDRGDPRLAKVDAVDWIEHIPFRETRNYVMRVAESQAVYRARLSGKTEPIRLSEELQAR